jgi:hypothetical protein
LWLFYEKEFKKSLVKPVFSMKNASFPSKTFPLGCISSFFEGQNEVIFQ